MFLLFGGYQGGRPKGWSQCALQCRLGCGMLHVGSPPGRLSRVTLLKNAPHLEVDSTPICSTIPLAPGSLHNQHLDPAPPIACIPFPSPVKMTVQVKNWF